MLRAAIRVELVEIMKFFYVPLEKGIIAESRDSMIGIRNRSASFFMFIGPRNITLQFLA